MKTPAKTAVTLLVGTLALVFASSILGGEPNKWRGQVYFKMVCTECHVQTADKTSPPNTRTMAEWDAYMSTNQHDSSGSSEPTVSYYTSTAYRESIKDSNKAAKKFLKLPGDQIYADVKAFMVGGARDSDTPASCN